jgi:hypothetical protein
VSASAVATAAAISTNSSVRIVRFVMG